MESKLDEEEVADALPSVVETLESRVSSSDSSGNDSSNSTALLSQLADKALQCIGDSSRVIGPTLGWITLIVLWSLLGGMIFYCTEHHREHTKIKEHQLIEDEYQLGLANNTRVSDMLDILDKRENFRMDGVPSKFENNRWSFSRAMFFSFTLCSTIGYGYTYPVTRAGKLCSIFYGIIGLVVFAASFFKIGQSSLRLIDEVITRLWPSHYQNVITQRKSHLLIRTMVIISLIFFVCSLGAVMLKVREQWTYSNGMYFMFISVSTIGLGDLSINSRFGGGPIPIMIVVFFGLCLFAAGLGQMQEDLEEELPRTLRRLSSLDLRTPRMPNRGNVNEGDHHHHQQQFEIELMPGHFSDQGGETAGNVHLEPELLDSEENYGI